MSCAYRCRECGREFGHFVSRPPGCATPDLCDVQVAEPAAPAAAETTEPIVESPPASEPPPPVARAPGPEVPPAESPVSPPAPRVSSSDEAESDPLAEFFGKSEPSPGAERAASPPPAPAPPRPASPPPQQQPPPAAPEPDRPVTGGTWRGWAVRGEVNPGGAVRTFFLVDPATADGAVWRSISAPANAAVQERLDRIVEAAVLKPERAGDGDGGSITRVGRRMSWASLPGDKALVSALVRDVARALHALHREGLAHLRLSPASLWYEIAADGPRFALAGLEEAVFTGAPGALRREHDVDHDAPELLGRHVRIGSALFAADWFALGRIVQALLLGGPVFERLFPVRRGNAVERAALIESYLREENADQSARAGAVEAARDGELKQPQIRLLRGLLTTNPAGRWGFAEIDEWLRGRSPADNYGMHARQTLFRLGDRAYTVEEAAAALASPELWPLAAAEVFERNRPGSLAGYVTTAGSDPKFGETWDRLMRLYRDGAFGRSHEVRREIVTGLFLGFLGGPRVGLSCGGKRFNRALLIERVQAARRDAAAWEWCEAMARGATVQEVQAIDPEAAPALQAWREPMFAVQAWLEEDGLPAPESQDERTDLMLAALASDAELKPRHVALREEFASAGVRRLHDWLHVEQLTRHQLVYVAYVTGGTRRDRLGLVTHDEWTDRETRRLLGEAADPALLLMWLRLRRALRWAWFVRRGWFLILVFWSLAGVAAWHLAGRRDYHWGALAGVALGVVAKALLHLLVRWRAARLLGWKNLPPALLQPATCTRQIQQLARGSKPRAWALARQIDQIDTELGRLRRRGGRSTRVVVPAMAPVWLVALGVTGLWAGIVATLWIREGAALQARTRTAWTEWEQKARTLWEQRNAPRARTAAPASTAPRSGSSAAPRTAAPQFPSGPRVTVFQQPGALPEPTTPLPMADLRRRADEIVRRGRAAADADAALVARHRERFDRLVKLADQGNADAALAAGLTLAEGRPGVGVDLGRALGYFDRSAQAGNLDAQVELAGRTFTGVLGQAPIRRAQARPVLEAANLKGSGPAAHYLGLGRLAERPLTTSSVDWAAAHFTDGWVRRYLPSYYELALLHLERRRSNPTFDTGVRYLREAADLGHRPSAALWSLMLGEGHGVPANPAEAARYERLAQAPDEP